MTGTSVIKSANLAVFAAMLGAGVDGFYYSLAALWAAVAVGELILWRTGP